MRYFSGVRVAARQAVATSLLVLVAVSSPVSAQQTGSRIQVMVCPQAGSSSFAITQPASDSKTNQMEVTLEGDVEYISQVDIYLDDTYSHTVALGFATTAFRSSVKLSPGTHTITAEATDTCSQTTHIDSVVVTYEPDAQPSTGTDIITKIPSHSGAARALVEADPKSPVFKWNFLDTIVNLFTDQQEESPITPPAYGATSPHVIDRGILLMNQTVDECARTALAITGTALVFAQPLVLLAASHMGSFMAGHGGNFIASAVNDAGIRRAGRGVGILLVALAFLL